MATLTATTVTSSGLTLQDDVAAASGGDKVSPNVFLAVTNSHATLSRTVTIVSAQVVDSDLAVADRAVVVAALTTEIIRIPRGFEAADDGLVSITYSDSAANITVLAFK